MSINLLSSVDPEEELGRDTSATASLFFHYRRPTWFVAVGSSNMMKKKMMMMMITAILILHGQQFACGLEFDFTAFNQNSNNKSEFSFFGDAFIKTDLEGGIVLTNAGKSSSVGRVFYKTKIPFNASFSTAFTIQIKPSTPNNSGHGMAFFLSPQISEPPVGSSGGYLGLFNSSTNQNLDAQIVAVEMDTYENPEFEDMSDNHIGIDVNGLNFSMSSDLSINLRSGDPITVWVVYNYINGSEDFPNGYGKITIFVSTATQTPQDLGMGGAVHPLKDYLEPHFYMGFSAANGEGASTSEHKILSWAFGPDLPLITSSAGVSLPVGAMVAIVVALFLFILICILIFFLIRKRKRSEARDGYSRNIDAGGVRKFKYSELRIATNNFSEKNLIGRGGFGPVFKGVLPPSKNSTVATPPPPLVAVKCIAKDSKQGEREFLAEVEIISRIRHRNLVQLQGWCREKKKLFLVYDYLPNGSLDQHLFFNNNNNNTAETGKRNQNSVSTLDWNIRYKIATGLAAALLYLHEEWEQQVIHRDVKSSNVILDEGFNARLSDFGLARLVEHDKQPQTTRVAGTFGYLAPEVPQTGKSTTASDVYSFGAVALEIVCGRPCLDHTVAPNEVRLVDWVWQLHSRQQGLLLNVVDSRMAEFCEEEAIRLMCLGLACSHPNPLFRPSMRQVHDCLINPTSSIPSIPTAMPLPTYNNSYTISQILNTSSITTQPSTSPEMSIVSAR